MMQLQRRIQGGLKILHYYTTRKWSFRNERLKGLAEELTPADRKRFPMDVRAVDWPLYFHNYVSGVRNFVLHEDPDISKAVRHHQRCVSRPAQRPAVMLLVFGPFRNYG